jgi:hypothetical protein
MSATPPPTLSLPDAWTETGFERGTYGPDDAAGLDARFEHGGGDAHLAVEPVCYRRSEGDEVARGLTSSFEHESFNPDAPGSVPERTVFAVQFGFRTVGRPTEGAFCLCTDADDALAVAVSLAALTDGPKDLRDHVRHHGGEGRGTRVVPSDREVLAGSLAALGPDPDPERCPFAGVPTGSHRLSIPVRYAVAVEGYPRTDAGMVRLADRCRAFRAAVSHREWTDRDLGAVDFEADLEREGPGEFRLDGPAAAALSGVDPARLALATF